jgi:hypothetical protein
LRVGFLYNTQKHQILHSLPTALELSILRPDIAVELWGATPGHLDYISRLIPLYPGARVTCHLLGQPLSIRLARHVRDFGLPPKIVTLFHNRRALNRLDALVVTDKTSLWLRRMGVTRPRLINTEHGAGDREVTIDPRAAQFDFNLLPSPRTAAQLLKAGYLRPGHYAVGAYAKLDIVRRLGVSRPLLFSNGRPTVLYNPHFKGELSSWPRFGRRILEQMAAQDRYNLIFAPHVRLFDPPTATRYADFIPWSDLPHIRIDLGSDACVDMTYTMAADLYLGDVSSQVYEFLQDRLRPCLFLNAHGAVWRENPHYRFWTFGQVLDGPEAIVPAIDAAFASHGEYESIQQQAVAETFDPAQACPGRCNAALLASYLDGAV